MKERHETYYCNLRKKKRKWMKKSLLFPRMVLVYVSDDTCSPDVP